MAIGAVALAGCVADQGELEDPRVAVSDDTVLALPVGSDDGIHYAGVGVPEMLAWGPAGFAVAADGSFWIADSVGGRLLHVDADGAALNAIDLAGQVVGAADLAVRGADVLVLDVAAEPPAVVRFDADGRARDRRVIPEEARAGLSGFALASNGDVLLEREGGAELVRLTDEHAVLDQHEDFIRMTALADARRTDGPRHGSVTIGHIRVDVTVAHELAGLRLLNVRPEGGFDVLVEEAALAPALELDRTVRRYDAAGRLELVARMPADAEALPVPNDVAQGPDGQIYAMLALPDRIEIRRLRFSTALSPVLDGPAAAEGVGSSQSALTQLSGCISRSAILGNASEYTGNATWLDWVNINSGSCAGRGKPRYLGGPGVYSSVSYDWGGFDTPAGFNQRMASGHQAGDIATAAVEGCSRGVDCSGFVTRVWGLTSKLSTSSIPGVSSSLSSLGALKPGDVMNKAGSHVLLFVSHASNGAYFYESTVNNHFDRVVYTYRSWSELGGYTPRRFNSVCP